MDTSTDMLQMQNLRNEYNQPTNMLKMQVCRI